MPRRDYSKVAFAATGDTTPIPTPVQPDGSISLQSGWGFDYQRDNGAGGGTPDPLAKNINRSEMNGVLNEITASIGEIQQNGLPIWVASAAPYPINAEVRHVDKIWRNGVANNSAAPDAVGSGWIDVIDAFKGRLINVRVITASGTYTPTAGTSSIVVEVQGGGGSGAASSNLAGSTTTAAAASGGGAGAYAKSRLTSAFSGVSVTVGLGGFASGSNGNPGGASSFGSIISCPGGSGGTVGLGTANGITLVGTASSPPTGTINISGNAGQSGGPGIVINAIASAGQGGSGVLGSGGWNPIAAGSRSGSGYGSGSSGANSVPGTSVVNNSVSGQPGVIIVWEYA